MTQLTEWHRESFSFLPTGLTNGQDGYNLVAHELSYKDNPGTAYPEAGETSPVTIQHFPAAHTRDGSISFKLTWNGLNVVFTGDTLPNDFLVENAQGVDVLIHEMVLSAQVWVNKNGALHQGDRGKEGQVFTLHIRYVSLFKAHQRVVQNLVRGRQDQRPFCVS